MLAVLTTHPIQYQVPLWQALARDGRVPFEVWYLTGHAVQPSLDREFGQRFAWDIDTLSGYPHKFLARAERGSPSSFWKCRLREPLRDRLRSSRVTTLWIQGWQVAAYWQAVREARAARVEVWLRGESNDLTPVPQWKRALKRAPLGWLFKNIDRFLYIGAANRRLYEKFGVPQPYLYPAPYAVDNQRFARQAQGLLPRRAELRRQWNIGEDAFCVLFCGKFIGKKRPMDIVAAARQIQDKALMPNIHLLFAGSGTLGRELRRSCRVVFDADHPGHPTPHQDADRSKPRASFPGFMNQTQISQAYVAADCLVLPSDHGETWGLVVNEALASGLPCVVSDACGCAEELAGDSMSFRMSDIPMLVSKLLEISRQRCQPPTPPTLAETVSSIVRAYHDGQETYAARERTFRV